MGLKVTYTLQEGKLVAKSHVKDAKDMPSGAELVLGNWEVEVDTRLDAQAFRCGWDCMHWPASHYVEEHMTLKLVRVSGLAHASSATQGQPPLVQS